MKTFTTGSFVTKRWRDQQEWNLFLQTRPSDEFLQVILFHLAGFGVFGGRFMDCQQPTSCIFCIGTGARQSKFVKGGGRSKLVKGRFEIDMDEFGVDKDVIRTSSTRSIR